MNIVGLLDIAEEMDPDDWEQVVGEVLAQSWLSKHEGGGHDQKTHGNWARGRAVQLELPGMPERLNLLETMAHKLRVSLDWDDDDYVLRHPVLVEAHLYDWQVDDDNIYEVERGIIHDWAMFQGARSIREAADDILGLEKPEDDTTLDPYKASNLDPAFAAGSRLDETQAQLSALFMLSNAGPIDTPLFRGTDASAERMGIEVGDEIDTGLLSFSTSPHGAARFGTETIFVIQPGSLGYQDESEMQMEPRYMEEHVGTYPNVFRSPMRQEEYQDMTGESGFLVGDPVDESAHSDLYYGAFEGYDDTSAAVHEVAASGRYRVVSVYEPGEVLRIKGHGSIEDVGRVVSLEFVADLRDGDGDGRAGENEAEGDMGVFVGKSGKTRRPAWLRLFDVPLRNNRIVEKHEGGGHDQKTHGNWATGRKRARTRRRSSGSPKDVFLDGLFAIVGVSEGPRLPEPLKRWVGGKVVGPGVESYGTLDEIVGNVILTDEDIATVRQLAEDVGYTFGSNQLAHLEEMADMNELARTVSEQAEAYGLDPVSWDDPASWVRAELYANIDADGAGNSPLTEAFLLLSTGSPERPIRWGADAITAAVREAAGVTRAPHTDVPLPSHDDIEATWAPNPVLESTGPNPQTTWAAAGTLRDLRRTEGLLGELTGGRGDVFEVMSTIEQGLGSNVFAQALKASISDRLADRIIDSGNLAKVPPSTMNMWIAGSGADNEKDLVRGMTDRIVSGWADSARGPISRGVQEELALLTENYSAFTSFQSRLRDGQRAAGEMFEEAARNIWIFDTGDRDAVFGMSGLNPKKQAYAESVVREFVKATYTETQQFLDGVGQGAGEVVLLHRGTEMPLPQTVTFLPRHAQQDLLDQTNTALGWFGAARESELYPGSSANRSERQVITVKADVDSEQVARQPASSWSTDYDTAERFARTYATGIGAEVMQSALVSTPAVWSTAYTGPGSWDEHEVIVLDSPGEAQVRVEAVMRHQNTDSFTAFRDLIDGDGDGYVGEDEAAGDMGTYVGKAEPELVGYDRLLNWLEGRPVEKHEGGGHDQKTHGNWARGRGSVVQDETDYGATTYTVKYGVHEETIEENYLNERMRRFVSEAWVYYDDQAITRTIAASMMGLPNFVSNGDTVVEAEWANEERYPDGVMEAIYRGEGPLGLLATSASEAALLMVEAVENDPTTRPYYRGMVVTSKSPILEMQEGDRFKMPPSSFGGSEIVAEQFTRQGMMPPVSRMQEYEESAVFVTEWHDVIIQLEPGARGVRSFHTLDPDTTRSDPFRHGTSQDKPFEIVAGGEFEVVKVERPAGQARRITVRHTSTFDPRLGEYVEIEPDTEVPVGKQQRESLEEALWRAFDGSVRAPE